MEIIEGDQLLDGETARERKTRAYMMRTKDWRKILPIQSLI